MKGRDILGDKGTDGRVILKWIEEIWCDRVDWNYL